MFCSVTETTCGAVAPSGGGERELHPAGITSQQKAMT